MIFVKQRKARLRTRMAEARKPLAAAHPDAAEALTRNFPDEIWPRIGAVVSGFWPIGDEISPMHLLTTFSCEGAVTALPLAKPESKLEFRVWTPGDELVRAKFGLSEPADTAALVEPELVLTPMLAFDRKGYRLGWGGGFYDRWIARARAARRITLVGVAFDGQRIRKVPRNRYDQQLDWIVTEKTAYRAGR